MVAADFDDVEADFSLDELDEVDFSDEVDLSEEPDLSLELDDSELDVAEPLLEVFADSRLSVR